MDNHVIRWIEEEGVKWYTSRKPPEKVFIRFGRWSRRPRSMNFYTGELEKGLSVYNARLEPDGTVSLIGDDWSLTLSSWDCVGALAGRLAFAVTGKVVGQGSDGEPVLTGVKLLRNPIQFESVPKEIKEIIL